MITGNKVLIKAVEEADLQEIYGWDNRYELKKMYNFIMEFSNYESFAESVNNKSNSLNRIDFTIIDKQLKKAIGRCSLMEIDYINKKSTCMMYIGDKDNRYEEYGIEAVKLLMRFAFYDLNLNRLGIWVFDFNKEAIRCFKKCGMRVEGIMREGVYRDGRYHDVYFMGILKQEYDDMVSGGNDICLEGNA